MPLIARLVSIGPARPGWPSAYEVLELLLWSSVIVLAALTPPRDARGVPNAPLQTFFQDSTGGGLCMFKRTTGVDCPGCGMTRGVVQTLHGDLVEAVRLNPIAPLVVLWIAWRAVEAGALVFARRPVANRIPWPLAWKLYGLALGVYIANGIWRVVRAFI